MGVEQKCKAYKDHRAEWDLVRDAIQGETAIKARGQVYLPRPSGMDDPEYKAYGTRPHWFGATGRTAEGLHGMVFQKPPVLANCPEGLKTILEDIDRQGTNIDQFASDLIWDTLPTNWGGVLVDYPQAEEGMDKGSAERKGYRTYAAWYSAETFINWYRLTKDNKRVLSLVVLIEPYEKALSDEFSTETKNRYRVLDLGENGKYRQRIFDDGVEGGLATPSSEYYPKKQGNLLDYIPFFTFPSREPEKSMLYDLACENVGHYQKTADYENGLHLTGIPTPYAAGLQGPPTDKNGNEVAIKLGGNSFLFIPDPSGKAEYLEFKGTGLAQIEKALQNTEERMAILGARIISAEKKGVESAESARIHRAGENSVLASFALNASDVITAVLREIASWENIAGGDKVTYTLNTDYDVSQMTPQELSALVSGWINGAFPRSVLHWNLQKGDRLPPEMDLAKFEEELAHEEEGGNRGPTGDDEKNPPGATDENDDGKATA